MAQQETVRIQHHAIERGRLHESFAQSLLKATYDRHERPLCPCRPDGIPLQIRFAHGRYHLARMPYGGWRHAPSCSFFEPAQDEQGRTGYAEDAIVETEGGATSIRLDVPLAKRSSPDGEVGGDQKQECLGGKRNAISLLALLHYLWEEAGFSRWHPKMQGRRGWPQIRKYIINSARAILVSGHPLHEVLLMPESYRPEKAAKQRADRDAFFGHLQDLGGERRGAIIIAPVAEICEKDGRRHIELEHMRDTWLWTDLDALRRLSLSFPRAVRMVERPSSVHSVIGIFTVWRNGRGYLWVQDAALMPVTDSWIPVDSRYEAMIAHTLVKEGRSFYKPLRYDADESETFPNFMLLDASGEPLPMEIYGFGGNKAHEKRKREKVAIYRASGRLFWQWDVLQSGRETSWPPFPSVCA